MTEFTGICPYCGQHRIVELPDDADSKMIEDEVIELCNCKEAQAVRDQRIKEAQIESAKQSARGTTFELFHEEFPDIEIILNGAINALVDKKFKQISITTHGRTKAKMTFSKDTIKVEREDKYVETRETDL